MHHEVKSPPGIILGVPLMEFTPFVDQPRKQVTVPKVSAFPFSMERRCHRVVT